MIVFPHCKINIGLDVKRKRSDGFHELETVMFPVRGLCDALEAVVADDDEFVFSSSGLAVDCSEQNNLCAKAYRLMRERYGIGGVHMHLHKVIPFGAGLGGGSSDAAFALKLLDTLFGLNLDKVTLIALAAELGSDTAFFIESEPMLATGRGEILEPVKLNLSGFKLVILKPSFGVGTAEAYSGVHPHVNAIPLLARLARPIAEWKECVTNDFEPHIFAAHPAIGQLKDFMYERGALYASMSGSGSTVYGIFDKSGVLPMVPDDLFGYQEIIF